MEIFASPFVMGAVVMSVALGSWLLGRWQAVHSSDQARAGGPVATQDVPLLSSAPGQNRADDAAVAGNHGTAQAERRSAGLDAADRLSALHAEISAYRRTEQVLAGLDEDQLQQLPVLDASATQRRNLDPTEWTIWALFQGGDRADAGDRGGPCADHLAWPVQAAPQPSPSASLDFTRV